MAAPESEGHSVMEPSMPKLGRSSSYKPTTHPLCVCTVPTVFCEFEHRSRELRIPYLCGGALMLRSSSAPRSRLPGLLPNSDPVHCTIPALPTIAARLIHLYSSPCKHSC